MTEIWLIKSRHHVEAALASEEEALTLLYRIRASNPDATDWKVEKMPVVAGEVQPIIRFTIQARISDSEEVFIVNEHREHVWPLKTTTHPDMGWMWQRIYDPPEAFGTLTVRGFDEEKVKKAFQEISEGFRTTEAMRASERTDYRWLGSAGH